MQTELPMPKKVKSLSRLTQILSSGKTKVGVQLDEAREKVEELLSQCLMPAEQEKVYSKLNQFAIAYFVLGLNERFQVISDEIFDLQRQEQDEFGKILVVPSIVQLPLDELNGDSYEVEVEGWRSIDTKSKGRTPTQYKASCSVPEVIPEARVAVTQAIQYSAELVGRAYNDDLLSKILIRDKLNGDEIPNPIDAKYNLVWAPSAWRAEKIERDPVISMRYANRNFLVYQWDIPEERSLDTLLRNFTEDLKG